MAPSQIMFYHHWARLDTMQPSFQFSLNVIDLAMFGGYWHLFYYKKTVFCTKHYILKWQAVLSSFVLLFDIICWSTLSNRESHGRFIFVMGLTWPGKMVLILRRSAGCGDTCCLCCGAWNIDVAPLWVWWIAMTSTYSQCLVLIYMIKRI